MPRPGPTGGSYANPFRDAKVTPGRVDMGVDYTGTGPIYAIGDGIVTNTINTGWPGNTFIGYRLTSGPFAGRYVYVAENVQPTVRVGQAVTSGTVIGYFTPGSIETGWAAPPGTGNTLAAVNGQACGTNEDPGCHPTWYGASFSALLGLLGAPRGILDAPIIGTGPGNLPQPGTGTWAGGGGSGGPSGCVPSLMMLHLLTRRL